MSEFGTTGTTCIDTRLECVRPRLLILSYCLDPNGTMEERNGWQRALLAAKDFDVTVLYATTVEECDLQKNIPAKLPADAIRFVRLEDDWFGANLKSFEPTFYWSYRRWHQRAGAVAKQMHSDVPFMATHLVTLCGFREPACVFDLKIPHVWGPIGGTHNFPKYFLSSIDLWNQFRESLRTAINNYQLHRCKRVRKAIHQSDTVIAASVQAQADLRAGFGIEAEVELETGIDHAINPPRTKRLLGQPLKILWCGRLRAWKGLPILLHAIRELPADVEVQLRVIGDGSSRQAWRRTAKSLGISDKIEWMAWPDYRETLQHYRWADVFAFTSLRDTSGTGLLEALAAGCPILGLDHQGASDIMTDDCAVRVPTSDWKTAVSGFQEGIAVLAAQPDRWLRLSHGATLRANQYVWSTRSTCVARAYRRIIEGSGLPMDMRNNSGKEIQNGWDRSVADQI